MTLSGVSFSGFSGSTPGTSSQEVLDVQGALVQLGYDLEVTGNYDASTSAAVLDFRSKWGLPVVDSIDGDVVSAIGMAGRPEYAGKFRDAQGMPVLGVAAFVGLLAWAVWG